MSLSKWLPCDFEQCHPLLWGGGILIDHWSTISSFLWCPCVVSSFAQLILIHLTVITSMVKAAIEFIYGSSVGMIPIHQVRSDVDFAKMVVPMQNMDSLYPWGNSAMKHVLVRKSGVWFKVWGSSLHIPTTRHGFVDAVGYRAFPSKPVMLAQGHGESFLI